LNAAAIEEPIDEQGVGHQSQSASAPHQKPVDSIESNADSGARGGIIEDGGRLCPEGNRRTHRQILAAAK
jgi:hypothetical protein